jgi:hypothetical protein
MATDNFARSPAPTIVAVESVSIAGAWLIAATVASPVRAAGAAAGAVISPPMPPQPVLMPSRRHMGKSVAREWRRMPAYRQTAGDHCRDFYGTRNESRKGGNTLPRVPKPYGFADQFWLRMKRAS